MPPTGARRAMKKSTNQPVKVEVVKKKRNKRKGPRITKMLKDKTVGKLRYVDTVSIDPGLAGISSHAFYANGIFDPDYTGTGHQPLMHDEYIALYGYYRVISSKIKVAPVPNSTSAVEPCIYGVYIDHDTSLDYTLGTSVIEDSRNKGSWGILNNFGPNYVGATPKTKTLSWNAEKHMAKEFAIDAIGVGGSPSGAHANFFRVWCASIEGNNPGNMTFLVQIDYVVEFTAPLTVTPS